MNIIKLHNQDLKMITLKSPKLNVASIVFNNYIRTVVENKTELTLRQVEK